MISLTKPQKLIYDMEKYAGGAVAVICGSVLFREAIETLALKAAATALFRLNDALRIRIFETGEGPRQSMQPFEPSDPEILHFESKDGLHTYADAYAKAPIPLSGPLCEMKLVQLPDACGVLIKLHHIIGDAWTLALLGNQLSQLLRGETPSAHSYLEYIQSEAAYLRSRRYEKDRAFFLEQFKQCDEVTYLSEKPAKEFSAARKQFIVSSYDAAVIKRYAAAHGVSPYMLFMTALAVYINRIKMNAERFYLGTALVNRAGLAEQHTAGMFVNTVPVLIKLDNDSSFAHNLETVRETLTAVMRHQKYNYGDVLADIRKEFGFGERLYDVMLSYQNATINGGGNTESTWYHSGVQTESLQVHIDDRDSEGSYRILYDYQTEKFTEGDMERLHIQLCNLLLDGLEHSDKKLYELKLLSSDEQQKLLYDFNDTAVDYPWDKCVHTLFEEQVAKTPGKTAVIACDRTMTYAELNEQANRIAHSLIERGIGVGDIVAFSLPRRSYLLATMLGILKSGAAYLPIDPDYPQERIDYMLSDSGAKLFITEEILKHLLDNKQKSNPAVSITSDSLCYCIYTSGSTGRPKGTLLTHRNVGNYVNKNNNNNVVHRIVKSNYDWIVSVTTVGFDIFVTESLLPLTNGMSILLADEKQANFQSSLAELLRMHRADVLQTTPTKMKMLIADRGNTAYLQELKAIILGGEALDKALVQELKQLTEAKIYNIYGPTETTVWSSNSRLDYPDKPCISTLFEKQVMKTPEKTAVVFKNITLSFSELEEIVENYSARLAAYGVCSGDVVALQIDRSHKLIVFQLAVIRIGGIFLPIDTRYPIERIKLICADAHVKLLISDRLETSIETIPVVSLTTFELTQPAPSTYSVPNNRTCYIIYTSGSTGQPKGCALTGASLINFCINNNTLNFLHKREDIIFASVNSVSFDYFIAESLLPLLNGYTTVILDDSESTNQALFLKAVEKHKINVVMTTPTRLKIFYSGDTPHRELEMIQCCCSSGEPLTPELLETIHKQSPYAQVYNPLGPSECTVWDVGGELQRNDAVDIHIGKPIANTQIYIVDKYMQSVPIGVTGELCIAGAGVGAGYLNRPDLTAERFVDNPFGEGKLYKTGDLAYWRWDGNIGYVGRNDFQVKIRGLRIELGEIENAIAAIDGIEQAVVVVRKDQSGRQLICAFCTGAELSAKEVRSAIGQKLPKYMLPHVITHLDALPLTTSGKTNRKALPEVDLRNLDSDTEYIAPVGEQEAKLASLMERVLQVSSIGREDDFFDLGGDSLKAIELIAALEEAGYHTDVKTVFESSMVKDLAAKLTPTEQRLVPLEEIPVELPATPAQLRVYTAQAMQGGTAYNVPTVFKAAAIDPARLEDAVNALIRRHESLRTRFEEREGQILQIVEPEAYVKLEHLGSDDPAMFIRPFDLSRAPLLRVGYYKNTVMIDLHHIITDGGAMPVFFRELNELYMGRELTAPAAQYRQFAVQPRGTKEDEAYWLSVFSDEIPVLEINTDFKRMPNRSYRGDVIYDQISAELHGRILEKCRELNITPYVFYMAAFNILLSKFSGNEDIVVGMPVSGRGGPFVNTVGMFVNTVALRNQPSGEKTVEDFLQEVKKSSIAAIEHQNYPYGELVRRLGLVAEGHNPLFDVMFVYQDEAMLNTIFGDQNAEILTIPIMTSKYDFTFNVMPKDGGAVLMVEYSTSLFSKETAKRWLSAYFEVLHSMMESNRRLLEISVIDRQDRNKLLYDFNDTAADYPRDKCVHTLFEEQAARTPDKTAVVACDRTLTYRELNEQANRIAHSLIERGIGVGDIVAFALPRRSYLLAAMLGILKSGAAYLPIEVSTPKERIDFMLKDSGAACFITDENITAFFDVDNTSNPNVPMVSSNFCYCLFTSGTTGKPKGTVIRHYNLSNFANNNNNNYQAALIRIGSVVLGVTTVVFDISVFEIFVTLLNGLTLVLASEEESVSAEKLAGLIKLHGVDAIHSTPTKMRMYFSSPAFQEAAKQLKILMIGAEVFTQELHAEIRKYTNAVIYNGYGPTETTIGVSFHRIDAPGDITIGKPIANTQIYIVDKYMQPVPIGVTGELCIAGDGVGAGYLNRPELTAEKFVDNPFGDGKLYKTGDLAYWREDGNIVYVGRNDFQVKIRGLRIELGEIENAISAINGISQAVAVVRKDENGRQLICAFYTGAELPAKEIRIAIGQRLPKYMLPHVITHLDVLPLTPSGKINRKALPEVELNSAGNETEYAAPVGEAEQVLATLMEKVLQYSPIGRDDNFFDLGGDSLKAIEFVSLAHQEGIEFPLQAVFDASTVRKMAERITQESQQYISYRPEDFTEIHELLAKNRMESAILPQRTPLGNILLSGATGFLGAHILADYLEHDEGIAYCLVRGKNLEDSEKRLHELLAFYFGDCYADCNRIRVLCADLRKDHFGLSDTQYMELLGSVGTAINAAASVKHYGSYSDSYAANVITTKRMVSFCMEAKAKLIHISTTSVSGSDFDLDFSLTGMAEESSFTERDLYIGQSLENVYVRSKFEAEKAVLDAVCRDGLRANIMRMGNLANRYSDGKFQRNHASNAFLKRMKAVVELGVVPDYLLDLHTEISPIDCAAAAIMEITRHFDPEKTIFHVENPNWIRFRTLFDYYRQLGIDITSKSGEEFEQFLLKTKGSPQTEQFFEAFFENLDKNNNLVFSSNIHIKTDFTVEYLKALGFLWPEITIEYTKKYVEYFKKIGYWKV